MAGGAKRLALIGDVGGTHCRLAVTHASPAGAPPITGERTYRCDAFAGFEDAAAAYLREAGLKVSEAVIAVAGPVADGSVAMTNCPWRISARAVSRALGLERCRLINDFEALAHALPALRRGDVLPLGGPADPIPESNMAVMGAGTGFGTAALVRNAGRQAVLVAEGGHMAFAAGDVLETEVRRRIAARTDGYVQVEHILSGPGLMNLHRALCEIEGQSPSFETPDAITEAADAGDARARAVTDLFVKVFGAVAGDLALALGARSGVFIAGGVSQRVLSARNADVFRARFEAKGEFSPYVVAIPTQLITHEQPGLLGAACALSELAPAD